MNNLNLNDSMKTSIYIILLFTIAIPTLLNAQIAITIEGTEVSHTVSPMVQGGHLVYVMEADSIYEDGTVAQMFQDMGAGFLRWPGGTVVTHYHWDSLSGQGWSDNWKPDYNFSKDKDPSTYMDIDEYMILCDQTGAEPMLGINMSSGLEWHREDEALNEAVDMIKYCQSKDFDVRYFYLDNESDHDGNLYNKDLGKDGGEWTYELYAEWFNNYADSIRKYIPDAILIANSKNSNSGHRTLIEDAGHNIDFIDQHYYWSWGTATWDQWTSKVPMEYGGTSYINTINSFNQLAENLGHPNIEFASLEWNIAPGPWQEDSTHTQFKTAIMQSEMQMQFIMADLKVASMWSTQWPENGSIHARHLLDFDNDYATTPSVIFFKLYANALGGDLVESNSSNPRVMVMTAIQDSSTAFVYMLSKHDTIRPIEITINGYDIISTTQAVSFTDPGILVDLDLTEEDGKYSTSIGGYTLNMIEFEVTPNFTAISNVAGSNNSIEIWPNPATRDININTGKLQGASTLKLFSMSGEEVLSTSFNANAVDVYSISVSHLPSGTYSVQVNDETGKQANSKLVIE
ncbi:MAG: T9SS type A sorting domain-containing protein [Flavobacteriales bacterium]|nr:T9SS type A sorting domain-containing protein [Flavobacteriales bacterium]